MPLYSLWHSICIEITLSIDWEEKTIRFTFLDNIIIRDDKISNKSKYRTERIIKYEF